MRRREFIATIAAAGLGAAVGVGAHGQEAAPPGPPLARRKYGGTDLSLSIVGLGGLVVSNMEQTEANDLVAWAIERGVNYFDVAPTYGDAQERLGPALEPYRDNVFLACKTTKRQAAAAREELEQSLVQLRTDHVDLYQFHALTTRQDVETVTGPGGALETFVAAREEGKVRHIGFSAHSVEAALQAMDAFSFDSILFPMNVVCFENGNFGPQVLERAQEEGVAILALKAMAWTPVPKGTQKPYANCWYQPADDQALARLALSFALDLPVVAAVPPGDPGLFRMAVALAQSYQPLTEGERTQLLAQAEGVEPIFRYAPADTE